MLQWPPLVSRERSRLLCALESFPPSRALKQILSRAVLSGLWCEPFVSARIVEACADSDLSLAQLAFDASPRRSAFSYTTMIRAHSSGPVPSKSLLLFSHMLRSGFYPDRFAFPFLLRASARSHSPPAAIHAIALRHGLDGDAHIATSLLHAYATCGLIDLALLVFDGMPRRTEVTWSTIISCCARSQQQQQDGLSLFSEMTSTASRPNVDTLIAALSCCASLGLITQGKALHSISIQLLPPLSLDELGTALVNMYARSGSLKDAQEVFDEIQAKDASAWTAMIGGLAMHGRGEEAVAFFEKMVGDKQPDAVTFTAILHACCHTGLVETGLKLFSDLKPVYGIEAKMEHYGAMVDMLGRSGRLKEAELLVASMPFAPNRVVWGALLHACAIHGELACGERLEENFLELGFGTEDEDVSGGFLVGMSNVYAGACRWQEVGRVREKMVARGVRKERAFSLLEVEGAVHRFLVGDTTHPLSLEIYQMLHRINEQIMLI